MEDRPMEGEQNHLSVRLDLQYMLPLRTIFLFISLSADGQRKASYETRRVNSFQPRQLFLLPYWPSAATFLAQSARAILSHRQTQTLNHLLFCLILLHLFILVLRLPSVCASLLLRHWPYQVRLTPTIEHNPAHSEGCGDEKEVWNSLVLSAV